MAGLLDTGSSADDQISPDDLITLLDSADTTTAPPAGRDTTTPAARDTTTANLDTSAVGAGDDPNDPGILARIGLALGGGPAGIANLTPEQKRDSGTHAMLNFGLALLRDSGWSTERKTAGQILAGGLSAAEQSELETEQAAARQTAVSADYALKKGDQQLKAAALRLGLAKLSYPATRAAAAGSELGINGPSGGTQPGAPPAALTPFVASNLPDGVSPAMDQIVRTVMGEAGGESPEGQKAVAAVIANRAKNTGMSTQDVIFARNQFEPWNTARRSELEGYDPRSPAYQRTLANVKGVIAGTDPDPTGGADSFYAPKLMADRGQPDGPAWAAGKQGRDIGGHRFYNVGYAPGGSQPALATSPGTATPAPAVPGASQTRPGTPAPSSPLPGPPAGADAGRPPGSAQPPGATVRPFPPDILAGLDASIRAAVASGDPKQVAEMNAKKQEALVAWTQKEQDRLHEESAADQLHRNAIAAQQQTYENSVALENQKAEIARQAASQAYQNQVETAKQAADYDSRKTEEGRATKVAETSTAQADSARQVLTHSEALAAIEPSLSGMHALQAKYPDEFGPIMDALKIGTPDQRASWDAAKAFQQIVIGMGPLIRPPGLNRLSNVEMTNFLQSLPSLTQSHDGRMIVLGMVRKMAQRTVDEDAATQDYIATNKTIAAPGKPSLNQALQTRFGNQSLFDSPPAFTGTPEDKAGAYRDYVNGHALGEPFYGLDAKTGRRVIGYRDPTRGGQFVYLPPGGAS